LKLEAYAICPVKLEARPYIPNELIYMFRIDDRYA